MAIPLIVTETGTVPGAITAMDIIHGIMVIILLLAIHRVTIMVSGMVTGMDIMTGITITITGIIQTIILPTITMAAARIGADLTERSAILRVVLLPE